MPVHKVPAGHLHEDLIAIEREGEEIATVTQDGDVFIVVTRHRKPIETRLAELTPSARLGAAELRAKWDGAA